MAVLSEFAALPKSRVRQLASSSKVLFEKRLYVIPLEPLCLWHPSLQKSDGSLLTKEPCGRKKESELWDLTVEPRDAPSGSGVHLAQALAQDHR
ncbi:hypothetical protein BDP55DRAFT_385261 [Colletotrichum godetiae]|uniref:Uncharacterized protein n=1 Tax=Colletotrichum godetiae TaxID=1209918 RepID=A0AAJ0ATB3_9PEZI|nr:uncharacterized protein BDP55DRAFT_385261 [Colletotrichum godetiae]KAK1689977.1 hypothetical protein BDP55DRAFT_385261 [Colletotrichum godetiae]